MPDDDDVEVRPEDALQVAQRALAKAKRVDEVEEQLDDLQNDLTSVKLRLSSYDEDRSYDDLSRDDKIGMVREELFDRAIDGRGRSMDYTDVRDVVFDGEPSNDHCYKLMRLAAEARGFELQDPNNGNRRLLVDPADARRGWAFSSATKTVEGEGGVE